VSTSTDIFLRFVDTVAADLDDRAVTGTEAAQRAFMSRFHFDRIIRSTAGEPPAAFRRRVLLERAAYRLVRGETGILEIALEAGYSSNEAFSRAFRRAYGRLPSTWRRSPRNFRLPSPNDVHFHPPGGLRLPAQTEVTSMDLLVKMVEHHAWLVGELVAGAEKLEDAQLDEAITLSVEGIDERPSIRSLLSRLIGQMDMWNHVIHEQPYDWSVEEHESVPGMRRRLSTVGPAFLEEVRRVVGENRLDETFVDAHCDPPEVFTYGGLVAHVLTFAAHRRLLVLGALASAGVTNLGNGDPRDWVVSSA
jgi:AraC family transcriptional regulator